MFAALWVKIEREKATGRDDDLFFIDNSTGCPALDAAQGMDCVRMRVFLTFVSFLIGRVAIPQVEVRLKMWPNSSESSVEGFCDLRREEVVREQENRLGMGGMGTTKGRSKGEKRAKTSRVEDTTMHGFWRRSQSYFYILW